MHENTPVIQKKPIESNSTWILPMYQCTNIESDFTKQKPILETDVLLIQEQH